MFLRVEGILALTVRQFLFIPSEVGVSVHEKSCDVTWGKPLCPGPTLPGPNLSHIAFCEVTKLGCLPLGPGTKITRDKWELLGDFRTGLWTLGSIVGLRL